MMTRPLDLVPLTDLPIPPWWPVTSYVRYKSLSALLGNGQTDADSGEAATRDVSVAAGGADRSGRAAEHGGTSRSAAPETREASSRHGCRQSPNSFQTQLAAALCSSSCSFNKQRHTALHTV